MMLHGTYRAGFASEPEAVGIKFEDVGLPPALQLKFLKFRLKPGPWTLAERAVGGEAELWLIR